MPSFSPETFRHENVLASPLEFFKRIFLHDSAEMKTSFNTPAVTILQVVLMRVTVISALSQATESLPPPVIEVGRRDFNRMISKV